MPVLSDTAYPGFHGAFPSSSVTTFTPTSTELNFAKNNFSQANNVATCLLMVKCFQRLGYFPSLMDVPHPFIRKICEFIAIPVLEEHVLERHDGSTTRKRQRLAILKFVAVKPYSSEATSYVKKIMEREIATKDDLVDLINISLEELVRSRYELPGFSALLEIAQNVRSNWSERYFSEIESMLSAEQKIWIDEHLELSHRKSLSF